MHLIVVLRFLVNFNVRYMLIAIFYCIKLVGFWWNSLVRIEIWTSWDSDFWFELSAVEYGSNTWILGFEQDLTLVRSPSLWNDRECFRYIFYLLNIYIYWIIYSLTLAWTFDWSLVIYFLGAKEGWSIWQQCFQIYNSFSLL